MSSSHDQRFQNVTFNMSPFSKRSFILVLLILSSLQIPPPPHQHDDHAPPVLCGHYLTALAASPRCHTPLMQEDVGTTTEEGTGDIASCLLQEASRWNDGGGGGGGGGSMPTVVTVHLKQGFLVDGLLKVLGCPGEVVVLRGVSTHQMHG